MEERKKKFKHTTNLVSQMYLKLMQGISITHDSYPELAEQQAEELANVLRVCVLKCKDELLESMGEGPR